MTVGITRHIHWILLMALLVVLSLVNVRLYSTAVDISPDTEGLVEVASNGAEPSLEQATAGADIRISHTLARPLFSPTRREFVAEKQKPAPTLAEQAVETNLSDQAARPALNLQGTRFVGQEGSALVALEPDQAPIWVKTGDQIKGWTVASVSSDTLVLASGEKKAVFALYESPDAGPHAEPQHVE